MIKEEYNKKINTLKKHLLGFENIITVTIFFFSFWMEQKLLAKNFIWLST